MGKIASQFQAMLFKTINTAFAHPKTIAKRNKNAHCSYKSYLSSIVKKEIVFESLNKKELNEQSNLFWRVTVTFFTRC